MLPPAGASVQDRPLHVVRQGAADAARGVLVVGQLHGDGPEGRRVVARLRRSGPVPAGTAMFTRATANPDGEAGRRRSRRTDC